MNNLSFITNWDWISPVWAFLQDFAADGPVSRFGVQGDCGITQELIQRTLKERGVHSWGYLYTSTLDVLMFRVKSKQARWAKYILLKLGVPILAEY